MINYSKSLNTKMPNSIDKGSASNHFSENDYPYPFETNNQCFFNYNCGSQSFSKQTKVFHSENETVIRTKIFAGYGKDDIEINVENDEILVQAKNESLGKLQYIFVVKNLDLADAAKIHAKYENGLLEIIIPYKVPEAKQTKIKIQ